MDAGLRLKKAGDLAGGDVAASDDHDQSALQLHENGKEAHGFLSALAFHAVGHGTQRNIALDSTDEGTGQQGAQFFVGVATEKLA
jgi:hypothetical protein